MFYDNVEAERWPEERLGELSWVLREWGKSFAGLLAELLVVFSVVYLLLRLLMRFFHWPNSLFAWLVARVSAVFGIAAPQRIGWFAGLLFFLAASLCFVNFLYLWSGVMNLARIGAMADTQFIYEKVISPTIYGGLPRFLSASFIPILLLSVAGAAYKAASGVAWAMNWWKPAASSGSRTLIVLSDAAAFFAQSSRAPAARDRRHLAAFLFAANPCRRSSLSFGGRDDPRRVLGGGHR